MIEEGNAFVAIETRMTFSISSATSSERYDVEVKPWKK
jgi:hypothetical protein